MRTYRRLGEIRRPALHTIPNLFVGESLTSWLERCAKAKGFGNWILFSEAIGLDSLGIYNGDRCALTKLSTLAERPVNELMDATTAIVGSETVSIGGTILGAASHKRLTPRFCPMCFREDFERGVPYLRSVWEISQYEVCHVHGVRLSAACSKRRMNQSGEQLSEALKEYFSFPSEQKQFDPLTGVEIFIADRLAKSHSQLDDCGISQMQLCEAIQVSRNLGLALSCEKQELLDKFDANEKRAAASLGLEILRQGKAFLSGTLAKHIDIAISSVSGRGTTGIATLFGEFGRILQRKQEQSSFGRLCDIVSETVFDALPLAEGSTVLGRSLPKRRLHSLASLRDTEDVGATIGRRVLLALGYPPSDIARPYRAIILDEALSKKVKHLVLEGLSQLEASKYVGLSQANLKALLASGSVGSYDLPGKKARTIVDPRDLDRFVRDLFEGSTPVAKVPPGSISIADLSALLTVTVFTVIEHVLDHPEVWKGHLKGKVGVRALLLDRDEMARSELGGTEGSHVRNFELSHRVAPQSVPRREAALFLKVKYAAINALIVNGHLDVIESGAVDAAVKAIGVKPRSLQSFVERHVSVGELNFALGRRVNATSKFPLPLAMCPTVAKGNFFYRSDAIREGLLPKIHRYPTIEISQDTISLGPT